MQHKRKHRTAHNITQKRNTPTGTKEGRNIENREETKRNITTQDHRTITNKAQHETKQHINNLTNNTNNNNTQQQTVQAKTNRPKRFIIQKQKKQCKTQQCTTINTETTQL